MQDDAMAQNQMKVTGAPVLQGRAAYATHGGEFPAAFG